MICLSSFCSRARLEIAACLVSIGLPGTTHSFNIGTALSSPNGPIDRKAAFRKKPSGESAATAAFSVASAFGALILPNACNAAPRARKDLSSFATASSLAATSALSLKFPSAATTWFLTHGSAATCNASSNCFAAASVLRSPSESAAVARTPHALSLRKVSPNTASTSASSFSLARASAASARSARSPALFNW